MQICKVRQEILIKSIQHLTVFNPDYDPQARPSIGKLTASYNGSLLTVTVEGKKVTAEVNTYENSFTFSLAISSDSDPTWESIFKKVLTEITLNMLSIAINQLQLMKERGHHLC